MRYLIDTCVISELRRQAPAPSVVAWMQRHHAVCQLSVVVLGELRYGITVLPKGARRERLEQWLHGIVSMFAERILPVDQAVAEHWALIRAQRQTSGRALPTADGLLAATARRHGLALTTRNRVDMEGCGVEIIDPWGG